MSDKLAVQVLLRSMATMVAIRIMVYDKIPPIDIE